MLEERNDKTEMTQATHEIAQHPIQVLGLVSH
jgi:hypothetical protein